MVYKPLRTWVDDHPLLYGNIGSLDPSTYDQNILSKPLLIVTNTQATFVKKKRQTIWIPLEQNAQNSTAPAAGFKRYTSSCPYLPVMANCLCGLWLVVFSHSAKSK